MGRDFKDVTRIVVTLRLPDGTMEKDGVVLSLVDGREFAVHRLMTDGVNLTSGEWFPFGQPHLPSMETQAKAASRQTVRRLRGMLHGLEAAMADGAVAYSDDLKRLLKEVR